MQVVGLQVSSLMLIIRNMQHVEWEGDRVPRLVLMALEETVF